MRHTGIRHKKLKPDAKLVTFQRHRLYGRRRKGIHCQDARILEIICGIGGGVGYGVVCEQMIALRKEQAQQWMVCSFILLISDLID